MVHSRGGPRGRTLFPGWAPQGAAGRRGGRRTAAQQRAYSSPSSVPCMAYYTIEDPEADPVALGLGPGAWQGQGQGPGGGGVTAGRPGECPQEPPEGVF